MDALSRTEYPAILERLNPIAASAKVSERVKRIHKVNVEVADWLVERRKVEDAYATSLRKLARRPLGDAGQDLGILDAPWKKIIASTEEIAKSHSMFADRINTDVELPLRNFWVENREMAGFPTIQGNLSSMAKELEDAQSKCDKLSQKGGKASAQKVDAAAARLQTASSQWNSQAPFILETLQSVDESRLNQLRDVLTQYETHEMDNLIRCQQISESALHVLVEVDTSIEIVQWAQAVVAGRPVLDRRSAARQSSSIAEGSPGGNAHSQPPAAPASAHADNQSEHSGKQEHESRIKRGFGTILGRRRQSVGYGRAPSPSKGLSPFGGRNPGSRDGRPNLSPRPSSYNLQNPTADNRLSSLAESPQPSSPIAQTNGHGNNTHPDSNDGPSSHAPNGSPNLLESSENQAPPGLPPSHAKAANERDSEGFSVPAALNDPISQLQQDIAAENEQPQYNVAIRPDPIPEQDADAQAALANVANTLKSANVPSRLTGTVRGRRDARHTISGPQASKSLDVASPSINNLPSPGVAPGRAAALAALSSEQTFASTASDATSIRSGQSWTHKPVAKHFETHAPGLHASVIETLTATFKDLEVQSLKVTGEIALIHNKVAEDTSLPTKETFRIDDSSNMEALTENRTFVHRLLEDKPNEFTVDLAHVSAKPTIAFSYQVRLNETNLAAQAPIIFRPAWKTDKNNLMLVYHYSLNPAFSSQPVTFKNVILVAHHTGARATGCQTRPNGTHSTANSRVIWRLGDVTLNNTMQKVICKLSGVEGAMPEAGHLEMRWEVDSPPVGNGCSISRFDPKGKGKEENDDPFADEDADPLAVPQVGSWVALPVHRKLATAQYEAR